MVGDFVRDSLDLHLFMARIMKEHAIFMRAGFLLPKDVTYAEQAESFKCQYDEILQEAIMLSDCTASMCVLESGELVTDKTLAAEIKTQELTGIMIQSSLTTQAMNFQLDLGTIPRDIYPQVQCLNEKAMVLTAAFAQFKILIWDQVTKGCLMTYLFPTQYLHMHKEALYYMKILNRLQKNQFVSPYADLFEQKVFWDEIMGEHAFVICHYLDPSEKELIRKAGALGRQFERLEQKIKGEGIRASKFAQLRKENISATKALANFKALGTEMILSGQLKSLLTPLLTDHTLREAYYYLKILLCIKLVEERRG